MDNILQYIKLTLAVLLFVCLFPMPYGYYTLVRFTAMTVFAFMAFSEFKKESKATPLTFTFGALALLFQPFFKVVLGKGIWCIVDVAVDVFLIYLWYKNKNTTKVNKKDQTI